MVELDCRGKSLEEVNAKIREAVAKGEKVVLRNAAHLHGVAAGLEKGEVVIEGDVGDYVAFLNSGAKVVVKGNAGNFVSDGSWGGEVIVEGNAGEGVGIYAYGGTIVVYGNVGNHLGDLLKGATVIVKGNAGDVVGLYMVGGKIVVCGDAGELVGDWMIRGEIYVGGSYKSLGHNAVETTLSEEDKKWLKETLSKYGIEVDVNKFKKIVPKSKRPFYG